MSEDIESVYEQWCDFKASPEYHLMVTVHGFKPLFRGVEIATLEAYGKERDKRMNREEAEKLANDLLSHYGKQSWDEHFTGQIEIGKLHGVEVYGTAADQWRIEAHFAHIDLPVIYATHDKMEAYERIGRTLMAGGIQRILVYVNDKLYQTITVNTSTD